LAQSANLFEILFFSKRKVGTATNVCTVAFGKDTAGTRSERSERQGRQGKKSAARSEDREERQGKEEERREKKWAGGGEGLRAAHLERTQLARQAERSELRDSGPEGKEKEGGERRGEELRRRGGGVARLLARRSPGQGAAGTQSERSE
jgi:hypothetical protein